MIDDRADIQTALREARFTADDPRALMGDTLKRLSINGKNVTGGGLSFTVGNAGLGVDAGEASGEPAVEQLQTLAPPLPFLPISFAPVPEPAPITAAPTVEIPSINVPGIEPSSIVPPFLVPVAEIQPVSQPISFQPSAPPAIDTPQVIASPPAAAEFAAPIIQTTQVPSLDFPGAPPEPRIPEPPEPKPISLTVTGAVNGVPATAVVYARSGWAEIE